MLSFLLNCKRIYNDFIKDEVTVYAAQASFFIVLSAAPFIMILLTLIQLIPAVSPEDLMHVMTQLLPSSIHPLIESVTTRTSRLYPRPPCSRLPPWQPSGRLPAACLGSSAA